MKKGYAKYLLVAVDGTKFWRDRPADLDRFTGPADVWYTPNEIWRIEGPARYFASDWRSIRYNPTGDMSHQTPPEGACKAVTDMV